MLAIVCPGQGSQKPGFLTPWLQLPGFRDRLQWLSAAAGMDLVTHGTVSDEATIKDTAVAQPLIVGAGLISLLALFEHPADGFRRVSVGAGHSVGEITAAAAAGVLSAEQAMIFVRERGAGMARASAVQPTGMSAVLGGDPDEVEAALAAHGLTAANMNAAGQVVAAGTMDQLAALTAAAPAKARVVPLPVAGAFHTTHMEPAVDVLAGYARAISTRDARVSLVSNRDGAIVTDGREVLARLVEQVRRPVRWERCMETFAHMGVTGLIEVPPAGTLTGLAKRALPGVELLALKTPDDIEAARRMIDEHAPAEIAHSDSPSWRLVVAPMKGTLTRTTGTPTTPGESVEVGAEIATVSSLRETRPVTAVHGGRVVEWLAEDGDPVAPGQPLLRLHPVEG